MGLYHWFALTLGHTITKYFLFYHSLCMHVVLLRETSGNRENCENRENRGKRGNRKYREKRENREKNKIAKRKKKLGSLDRSIERFRPTPKSTLAIDRTTPPPNPPHNLFFSHLGEFFFFFFF